MANKSLFKSLVGAMVQKADTRNNAGGPAYKLSPEHALAQYASTGCLNSTYYASAEDQLETLLMLCAQVDHEYIARTAVWCRREGYMKDIPALLCAVLTLRDGALCERIFPLVIDNGKMLRNFVQVIRSGAVGRKSLGSRPKRMVRTWLESQSDNAVFRASVGNDPSLADIIKMVHPKPANAGREALYAYLIGRGHDSDLLPDLVKAFEAFKKGDRERSVVPEVPFEMLTALDLTREHWTGIARNASWQMTRMNLNTFARHGVFEVPGMTELIAELLRDPGLVKSARVFPYQLMAAYTMTNSETVPAAVRDALHDAMELATSNVPKFEGQVYVFPDVSGSMHSPATGYREGSSSKVRCIDVAALVSACVLRRNSHAVIVPFHDTVVSGTVVTARDSVMTNAERLASLPSGGTNCSAPLAWLNEKKAKGDLVIYVSDNESWVDAGNGGRGTATMAEWESFRSRNPNARLVCIDVQPNKSAQTYKRNDILNIGGFSDNVFQVINEFAAGRLTDGHWADCIQSVQLPEIEGK